MSQVFSGWDVKALKEPQSTEPNEPVTHWLIPSSTTIPLREGWYLQCQYPKGKDAIHCRMLTQCLQPWVRRWVMGKLTSLWYTASDARPTITFPAAEHHVLRLAPNYTAWRQRHECKQLAQKHHVRVHNSSGDEIAKVNFYAVRPEATQIRWNNAK